ncbi:MAG TPA: hypothetical protein VIQ31_20055 [Phormidium sp.]
MKTKFSANEQLKQEMAHGLYRNSKSHSITYTAFATHVEYIIKKDVFVYMTEILEKKYKCDEKEPKEEKGKKEEKDVIV